MKLHRDLASRNRGDQNQKVEMAAALYAQALSDPGRRAALLRESQALLASLPAQIKALNSVRVLDEPRTRSHRLSSRLGSRLGSAEYRL